MLAIRLPATIEKRLERLAKRTGRTKTYYAREAILQHLDDLEDIYLAEKRMEAIESGRVKTVPLEEIMRQHGLDY
jgi:RHH-type rel operon transcriptional repressor/antitoxin RelB